MPGRREAPRTSLTHVPGCDLKYGGTTKVVSGMRRPIDDSRDPGESRRSCPVLALVRAAARNGGTLLSMHVTVPLRTVDRRSELPRPHRGPGGRRL